MPLLCTVHCVPCTTLSYICSISLASMHSIDICMPFTVYYPLYALSFSLSSTLYRCMYALCALCTVYVSCICRLFLSLALSLSVRPLYTLLILIWALLYTVYWYFFMCILSLSLWSLHSFKILHYVNSSPHTLSLCIYIYAYMR